MTRFAGPTAIARGRVVEGGAIRRRDERGDQGELGLGLPQQGVLVQPQGIEPHQRHNENRQADDDEQRPQPEAQPRRRGDAAHRDVRLARHRRFRPRRLDDAGCDPGVARGTIGETAHRGILAPRPARSVAPSQCWGGFRSPLNPRRQADASGNGLDEVSCATNCRAAARPCCTA